MPQPPVITLTTDFGAESHYVAQLKGAILSIARDARIVDITHNVPPQNVEVAAWLVAAAIEPFPESIHVVVVDPGVGSDRVMMAVETDFGHFVAPDNGVLTRVLRRSVTQRVVQLTESKYWRAHISHTFHGRDVMGPVAAHIANGVGLNELGPPLEEIVQLEICVPQRQNGALVGRIEYVDSFGNCVTNITPADCQALADAAQIGLSQLRISLAGRDVVGVQSCYADVEGGELLALIGSGGQLEVAVAGGHAAHMLSAGMGDPVRVSTDLQEHRP